VLHFSLLMLFYALFGKFIQVVENRSYSFNLNLMQNDNALSFKNNKILEKISVGVGGITAPGTELSGAKEFIASYLAANPEEVHKVSNISPQMHNRILEYAQYRRGVSGTTTPYVHYVPSIPSIQPVTPLKPARPLKHIRPVESVEPIIARCDTVRPSPGELIHQISVLRPTTSKLTEENAELRAELHKVREHWVDFKE